jgi:RNA polymerase sigma factor (sigma-70 family)
VGRGRSTALVVPERVNGEGAESDQRLVAAVRQGDDRAFEVLYERYQRRIHAYVLGMVKDHGRAEDVTQEVFVSALRRMRETEQPLVFKPWLYQIAKNSCIDAFRRAKRAEEVSYDADDALSPGDHSKLVGTGPSPDAAVAAKEDLDNLRGAFGGLSETHHEILVLRELEGLSYTEIGRRMGMSRPAVESTLFRARRRLSEEYDDIVSGARCLRIQEIIVTAADQTLGVRDSRRLARHLAHCQPCRREALEAGLDRGLFTRPSVPRRIAGKLAGWLPLPGFLRLKRTEAGDVAATSAPSGRWTSHLPLFSDGLASGWGRAATGAAVLVAGLGAGAGVHQVTSGGGSGAGGREASAAVAAGTGSVPAAGTRTPQATATSSGGAAAGAAGASGNEQQAGARGGATGTGRGGKLSAASTPAARPGADAGDGARTPFQPAAATPGAERQSSADAQGKADQDAKRGGTTGGGGGRSGSGGSGGGSGSGGKGGSGGGGGSTPGPAGASPAPSPSATPGGVVQKTVEQTQTTVQETTKTVTDTVDTTTGAVQQTAGAVTETVDETVDQVTGGGPVSETVDQVTDTVDDAVGGVGQVTDGVTDGLGGLVGGLTGGNPGG